MIYKHSRQDLCLCGYSFARYSEKCFTQVYRALYGDAMLVSKGHQHGGRIVTETSVIEFCYLNEKLSL